MPVTVVHAQRRSGEESRRKVHVVVAGASEWGQNACARILHRVYAHGGRVTLIIARRFEERFRTERPATPEWREYTSLLACIEDLRDRKNQPIDYIFDDQLQHLATDLLRHRSECRRLGYVATGAEEHYRYARVLVSCCDRVLVEKPVSKLVEDVRPGGRFHALMTYCNRPGLDCQVYSCEHFAFRKGFTDARNLLFDFVKRHRRCGRLRYEFRFFEPAEKAELRRRSSAMQDGSILDVAITHGLGPLAYLLRKVKHPEESRLVQDRNAASGPGPLHAAITWNSVQAMQARDKPEETADLAVAVLAETAVKIEGTYSYLDEPPIALSLESGKGGSQRERHFRLVCEACREEVRQQVGRHDHEVFVGVSLGPAGYSVSDFAGGPGSAEIFAEEPMLLSRPSHPLEILEADKGWKSDLLAGSSGEAENAQAAMLEAFIAPEADERFLSIDQACQIVRLGIEAQALAFLGSRGSYSLDKGVGAWEGESVQDCSKKHQELKRTIWRASTEQDVASDGKAGRLARAGTLDQLTEALGPILNGRGAAYCRVVSVLGAEGLGNTDLAVLLEHHLKTVDEGGLSVHLLYVRRDEHWALGEGSGESTVARLLRDLAKALGIASVAAEDLVGDLLRRIRTCWNELRRQDRILILNGIDRLGLGAWEQLTRLLNELPSTHRLVFITNRGDRASGLIFGSEEVIDSIRLRYPEKASCFGVEQYREALRVTMQGMLGDSQSDGNEATREALDWCLRQIQRIALGNATVERQLCSWLRNVVLTEFGKKRFTAEELSKELRRALVSITVPPSVTPDPERLLDRISQACLAELAPRELHAVSVLARLPDGVPRGTLDSAFPGMDGSIKRPGPMASLFDRAPGWGERRERDLGPYVIFPRVRRMAMRNSTGDLQELWERRREIAERRLLCALPEDEELVDARLDRLLALGERVDRDLGTLDLDGTLLEEVCIGLIEELEIGLHGRTDGRPSRLLSLLARRPTNLGMSVRARLLSFYSWSELGKATRAEEIVRVMNDLAEACDVAEGAEAVTEALNEAIGRVPVEDHEIRVWKWRQETEAHRSLLVAELFRAFTWHWMFGVKVPSPYVFGRQESLRQAERSLQKYLTNDENKSPSGDQDTETRLLKAQSIAALALFYSWSDLGNPAGVLRPKIEDSYLCTEASLEDKTFSGLLQASSDYPDQIQRLRLGTFLSQFAAERCVEVAMAEESRQGSALQRRIVRISRRSGGYNFLNCALLYGVLARTARKACTPAGNFESQAEDLVMRARQSLGDWQAAMEEPYYLLTCARLIEDGTLDGAEHGKPQELAARAEEGYRRRNQDYFARLAKTVKEDLSQTDLR